MKTIASFTVNHDKLEKGMYVSRIDGDVVTYDIRMKKPNQGDYLSNGELHTIEHLFATYARNSEYKDGIIYIGPMGCRTGFYLLTAGRKAPKDVLPLVKEMCDYILYFEGEIPGARPEECGNYSEQNLNMAKYYTKKYLSALERGDCFTYPGEEEA